MARISKPNKSLKVPLSLEKGLAVAIKQVRNLTGRGTGDEAQTWVGNNWYAFVKNGKSWILLHSRSYSNAELKLWDEGFEGETKAHQRSRISSEIREILAH